MVNPTGFGAAAAEYTRGRPSYPLESVRWLTEGAHTVADIGAGTGKLTSALASLGLTVTAVEPDPQMLAQLQTELPTVTALAGSAESLPLPSGSMDALTFGQAWHWVDPVRASAEAGRVLKPGGTLGLIWNIRDESVPWVAELTSILHASAAEEALAAGGPTVAAPFATGDQHVHSWVREMSLTQLLDMIKSRSYFIAAEPAEQQQILSSATELAQWVGGGSGVAMPYLTQSYRFRATG